MKKQARQAKAFLATVDRSLPYDTHVNNAFYDAELYRWGMDVLAEVLRELKKIYNIREISWDDIQEMVM